MKFEFIRDEKANHSIKRLCEFLGVSRSGYHRWAKHGTSSRRADADEALVEQIEEVFRASSGTYGSPRVHQELKRSGVSVGRKRVERLMRARGLRGCRRGRRWNTTVQDPTHRFAENHLNREFVAERPNQRWVADITCVRASSGWVFVAVVLDLFSRMVVGWSVSGRQTQALTLRALENATKRRGAVEGLLFHSDRGSQYTSEPYQAALDDIGATSSMSRTRECWDNAVAESFFATLKIEFLNRQPWRDAVQVEAGLINYIEGFYNCRRLHSTLGYNTPVEVEARYYAPALRAG